MADNIQKENMLKVGTMLNQGKYRIDAYLASGGFGNTYVATDTVFDEKIAIKELFIKGVCGRQIDNAGVSISLTENQRAFAAQQEKFRKEAIRLRKLSNSHIIKVHDLFDENGTSYYVMDFVEGESLSARMKRTQKPMLESEVLLILSQILDALECVHNENIWHLDLKPANIMIDTKGNVQLIDFGASKQLKNSNGESITTSSAMTYTPGFAPSEQTEQSIEKFGPWTDLYSLGATLYNLLTMQQPPQPSDIFENHQSAFNLPSNISKKTERLIIWLMQLDRTMRPQSVAQVKQFLEEADDVPSSEENVNTEDVGDTINIKQERKKTKTPTDAPKQEPEQNNIKKYILVAAVALLCLGCCIYGLKGNGDTIRTETLEPVNPTVSTTGIINGHEWVDLGLSVKWATMNVGASSPSDYGGYYAWGETSTKSSYDWSNCFDCLDSEGNSWGTYKLGGQTRITPSSGHDTARENWGGSWRMPTDSENEELCNKCKWTWTSKNGHNGYNVTGPNGNSIFLPAAGWRNGTSSDCVGELGIYWSSSLSSSYSSFARDLLFDSSSRSSDYDGRCNGLSVRPVTE